MKSLGSTVLILAVCFSCVGCRQCGDRRILPLCNNCGCGQYYWGDWNEGLANCHDCCNCCGDWNGPPAQYHRGTRWFGGHNNCGSCGGGCSSCGGGCSSCGGGCSSSGGGCGCNGGSTAPMQSQSMPADGQVVPGSEQWSEQVMPGPGNAPTYQNGPANMTPNMAPGQLPGPTPAGPRPAPMTGTSYRLIPSYQASPQQRNAVRARTISNARRTPYRAPMPSWAESE
ncbi:MAG TPA: hypothetical protein VHV77_02860 [Pirellulales bacterium]|jgi:hypothetical protein|nr:hypothetical protein [Pirellulales bacterium]